MQRRGMQLLQPWLFVQGRPSFYSHCRILSMVSMFISAVSLSLGIQYQHPTGEGGATLAGGDGARSLLLERRTQVQEWAAAGRLPCFLNHVPH